MIRQIEVNSEEEWLVAQRALEVHRAVSRAARAAQPGRGLMETEAKLHEQGDGLLRTILENAVRQHVEAKKNER